MTEQQKALQALLEQLQETKADTEKYRRFVSDVCRIKDANDLHKYRMFPAASEFTVVKMVG